MKDFAAREDPEKVALAKDKVENELTINENNKAILAMKENIDDLMK